ncbi:chemotaxis protein CheB [Acidisphaera sp. L21]|uniref:chemotaxis protein CheB n=1 Tax=Acidisphaera sp. L21 TaxID=1641851 RepID=UPI00131E2DD8|nr:chemotaxis protein CheB [Acidisphaera sp. L21]
MDDQPALQVVGIGASAGGVQALQAFFEALPDRVGAAFVVIMHLDPHARSEMVAILAMRTSMPVWQVGGTLRLEADNVYVIAPNSQLIIEHRMISALAFDLPRGQRAPIDLFFRSLADQSSEAFAIVLTGAGADGATGVTAVKEAGGIVLVQDPGEAEYSSMPRNAIATEVADFVLPVRELAEKLVTLVQKRGEVAMGLDQAQEEDLRRILSQVQSRTGHDFSQYKRATVLRRLARRMQLTQQESSASYLSYLKDAAGEAQALFGDFLISVTTFFRDPDSFASLARDVIPKLFEGKAASDSIRVWVPGVATGEEAYTIGMLLLEEADRRKLRPEIQIFGSDLDAAALVLARQGRYPASIAGDLTQERLERFFWREGDHFRVRRELRDLILFANHSLLKDPPFSRLDLVSCRNLLIYMDRELQHQILTTFHYGLKSGGFLFLGSSENADQPNDLFRALDRDARIYQSAVGVDSRSALPLLIFPRPATISPLVPPRTSFGSSTGDAAIHRQMLERVAPPSILVDDGHRAVHLSETAGRFLQPSGGSLSTDVVDLVREELRFDLRSALHRAFDHEQPTLSVAHVLPMGGEARRVYVQVRPITREGHAAPLALVLFIEGETVDQVTEPSGHKCLNDAMQQIQHELQATQARLRTMREESEAGNEELRAANEELQSINEEYRSTSEELETSKEELQSINEELQTVNGELKLKLESVSRAHSDLQNLMAATDFGTLFLDSLLRIKRFTPRLVDLFNVTENDEGRPITDFTHSLDFDDMADQARKVIKDLIPIEREIPGRLGGWYLVRMRPYRTIEDKIDGVVATFIDITERRRAEEALRLSEEHLRQEMRLVELSRSPIFVWDFDGGILKWNRGSEDLYGFGRDEAIGQPKETLLHPVIPGSTFQALRQALLDRGQWKGEVHHRTKGGKVIQVESEIELVLVNGRRLVLESTRDITERKRWEEQQRLLLDELSHRVRNTLTVVQSMARQTLRNTKSGADFVERFEGRLSSLARAHKILVDSEWKGAELSALIESQLQAHTSDASARIQVDGEALTLPPDLATPFGLILHELATNAIKYGSLSSETGTVLVQWNLRLNGTESILNFVWREAGGPPVEIPSRKGFGSSLIERGLSGAAVRRDFLPSGFVCTIEVPLANCPA